MSELVCNRCGRSETDTPFFAWEPRLCAECVRLRRHERNARKAQAKAQATQPIVRPVVNRARAIAAGDFIPDRDLSRTWAAVVALTDGSRPPTNLLFIGPSGCGKTEAARYLAASSGMAFTKVDAAAMTDPEAWFGTREVVVEDGAPKTVYAPSAFVVGIQQPGVMLIDEANRSRDEHRNILLPLLDGTGTVSNPFTGEVVRRHPQCIVILTANVGLQFTGTYAVDPALITRSITLPFDYLPAEDETKLVVARHGIDHDLASLLVRFAGDARNLARSDEEMPMVSTREVLKAAELMSAGLDHHLAIRVTVLNAASTDGGGQSVRAKLEMLWTGIAGRR